MKKLSYCLALCCFSAITQLAQASNAVMTVSTTAPTTGADDIFNLTSNGANPNNSTTAIWSDQPGQGQSFTTLSNLQSTACPLGGLWYGACTSATSCTRSQGKRWRVGGDVHKARERIGDLVTRSRVQATRETGEAVEDVLDTRRL